MRLRYLHLGLVAVLLGVSLAISHAQPAGDEAEPPAATEGKRVYVLPVEGLISDITLMSLERRVAIAEEAGADLIVLEIDTYGGLVSSALEIGTFIKNVRTETLAWVNDKAISAGAMIAVAADGIVMAERSRIGDSAPIAMGQQLEGTERAKIESPILEEFRDSARRNGYPIVLTEAMVRLSPAIYQVENVETGQQEYAYSTDLRSQYGIEPPRGDYEPPAPSPQPRRQEDQQPSPFDISFEVGAVVAQADDDDAEAEADTVEEDAPAAAEQESDAPAEGEWRIVQLVNPANTLVTLSQDEAIEHGFARRIVADDAALMAMAGATEQTFERLEVTWSERAANVLVSPGLQTILMILLLLGAYMELQSPGVGLPGAVAAVALLLLIGGPFVAGLANMVDVLIIAAGLILIAVELFLIPGFGVTGILGVLLVLGGFVMTLVPPDPEPGFLPSLPATWQGLRQALTMMMIAVAVSGVVGYFLARHIERVPFFRHMVLDATVDSASVQRPVATTNGGGEGATRTAMPATTPAASPYGEAVHEGATGRAMTGLRPAGRMDIDGQIIDVVTSGRWVEAGEPVRIIEIRGNRVVVDQA